jgi:hypothetical protein
MPSNFFKGEKKKPKKNKDVRQGGMYGESAPTYVMPEIITKKKSEDK